MVRMVDRKLGGLPMWNLERMMLGLFSAVDGHQLCERRRWCFGMGHASKPSRRGVIAGTHSNNVL